MPSQTDRSERRLGPVLAVRTGRAHDSMPASEARGESSGTSRWCRNEVRPVDDRSHARRPGCWARCPRPALDSDGAWRDSLIVLDRPTASWQDNRRESARREILVAAWEAAREHGLGSLTLRDVAARVGMRPPSLYWHFDSKMTLYEAMFGQAWAAYNDVQKDMEERLPTSPAGCSGPCELFGEGRTAEPLARFALGAPGGGGPPPFDDLVARDAEDVETAQHEHPAIGGSAEQLADAGAVRVEVLDDEVALGDVVVGVAAPVGYRGPDDLRSMAQALRAVGRAGERRVVVDEVVGEVAVDGREVALGEELLDEALDEVLVAGELVSGHAEEVRAARARGPSQLCGVPRTHPSGETGCHGRRGERRTRDAARLP